MDIVCFYIPHQIIITSIVHSRLQLLVVLQLLSGWRVRCTLMCENTFYQVQQIDRCKSLAQSTSKTFIFWNGIFSHSAFWCGSFFFSLFPIQEIHKFIMQMMMKCSFFSLRLHRITPIKHNQNSWMWFSTTLYYSVLLTEPIIYAISIDRDKLIRQKRKRKKKKTTELRVQVLHTASLIRCWDFFLFFSFFFVQIEIRRLTNDDGVTWVAIRRPNDTISDLFVNF